MTTMKSFVSLLFLASLAFAAKLDRSSSTGGGASSASAGSVSSLDRSSASTGGVSSASVGSLERCTTDEVKDMLEEASDCMGDSELVTEIPEAVSECHDMMGPFFAANPDVGADLTDEQREMVFMVICVAHHIEWLTEDGDVNDEQIRSDLEVMPAYAYFGDDEDPVGECQETADNFDLSLLEKLKDDDDRALMRTKLTDRCDLTEEEVARRMVFFHCLHTKMNTACENMP